MAEDIIIQEKGVDKQFTAKKIITRKVGGGTVEWGPGGGGYTKPHTFEIPILDDTRVYNSSSQTPNFSDYYYEFMSRSGDTSATNAGEYDVEIALTDTENCQWADFTTEPKDYTWHIAKAALPKPTFNRNKVVLTPVNATATVVVDRLGDGVISAVASDPNLLSVTVNGTIITITANSTLNSSDETVTVTVAEGTNYLAYTNVDAIIEVKVTNVVGLVFTGENLTLGIANSSQNWDGTLQYSTNGSSWLVWNGSGTIITTGLLYLRGTGNTRISSSSSPYSCRFVIGGSNVSCEGNIETLLDYETVENNQHPQMSNNCFSNLFNGCTSLISAPSLEATTLSIGCYANMFYGCTGLIEAPELPANTLETFCYYNMFKGCTSLITTPNLPATTLADECYNQMFQDCTSLVSASNLPATALAEQCYQSMFNGCTSLIYAPKISATTLLNADACCRYMFSGCTNLISIPSLLAVALAKNCYYSMFYGCSKIKISQTSDDEYVNSYRIPASGNGTTATNALQSMFAQTGGSFAGTPTINTTYYTANEIAS